MTTAVTVVQEKEKRSFRAQFAGTCESCQTAVNTGDLITWDRTQKGKIWHAACDKTPAASPAPAAKPAASAAMAALAKELAPALSELLTPAVDEGKILALIEDRIDKLVQPTFTVQVKRADGQIKKVETAHADFPKLMHLINNGKNIYLWGPPGSGKSTAAQQAAEALALAYGYISLNPQTPESRLIGYMDAKGDYVKTHFRTRYQDGGVFCIDELDNASAGLVTTLNSGLENGHMAFPDALVERHKDFILVAAGNTNGKGGNAMFPERRPFDAAFAERFVFFKWEYDEKLERTIALGYNKDAHEWLSWVKNVRKYCLKNYPRLLVSPRASIIGAQLLATGQFSWAEVAEMAVFKGTEADIIDKVLAAYPLEG